MNLRISTLILVLLLLAQNLFAQLDCDDYFVNLSFSAPYTSDGSPIEPGSDFCVDFRISGFTDVAVINFIVSFDPSVIQVTTDPTDPSQFVTNPVLTMGGTLPGFDFIDNFTNLGYMSFIWSSPSGFGVTIPDDDTFTVCFTAVGEPNDCTTLNLVNNPVIGSAPLVGIDVDPPNASIPCEINITPRKIAIACTSLYANTSTCSTTANEGSISFSLCGGQAPYDYILNESGGPQVGSGTILQNDDIVVEDNLPSGNYILNVTDGTGTPFVLSITVDNLAPLTFDLLANDPPCPNFRGDISVDNIMGGNNANYNIEWSNGTFNTNMINVFEGDYTVTVTDANGCSATDSRVIAADTIRINIIDIDSSSCGGNDGQITFDISGGDPFANGDYEVRLNNQAIMLGSSFSIPANSGINSITIRDQGGCPWILDPNVGDINDTVYVNVPDRGDLSVDIMATDVLCFGDSTGSVEITVSDTLKFDFSQPFEVNTVLNLDSTNLVDNNGDPILGGISNNIGSIRYFENLFPGTFFIRINTDNNCSLDTFFTINEPDPFFIEKDSINPDCTVSGEISVTPMGGVSPYMYEWDFDPTFGDSLVTNLLEGQYLVTVTDINGCEATDEFNLVGQGSSLNVEIIINKFVDCLGLGELEATVPGGASNVDVRWYDNDDVLIGGNPLITGLDTGTYYAIVIDNDTNCTGSDTIDLTADTTTGITAEINIIQEVNCDETKLGILEVMITGGSGMYQTDWFNSDGDLVGVLPTADFLVEGEYIVIVADQANNCTATDTVMIRKAAEFTFDHVITHPTCYNTSDGVISIINTAGGVEPYTYDWSHAGVIGNFAPGLAPGFFTVTITDLTDCSVDTTFEIIAPPVVTGIVTTTETSCFGTCDATATAEGSGGTITAGDYEFLWSNGDTGMTVSGLCAGVYSVFVLDELGCQSEEIPFVVNQPDSLSLTNDPFFTIDLNCAGDETGMIGVNATGGVGEYNYQWVNNISDTTFASGLGEGVYGVTVTDENMCTDTTSYALIPAPAVFAEPFLVEDIQCFGGSTCLMLANVGGGVPGAYTFSVNINDRIPIDSCYTVIAGDYRIDVFDATGICSYTTFINVPQPDQIIVTISGQDEVTLGDSTNILNANIFGGVGIDTIIWTSDYDPPAELECRDSLCNEVYVFPSQNTIYTATMVDENGCTGSDDYLVEVLKVRRIYLPNVFNPSSIRGNERFMVFIGRGAEVIQEFSIYDRWGNQVFSIEDVQRSELSPQLGWDGRINGDPASIGVYTYYAKVKFIDAVEPIVFKGDLTLVR